MNDPYGPKNQDYLASLLGFPNMKALQDHRLAEERAAADAALEAEEKAREAEVKARREAEDLELGQGIQNRMIIQINDQTVIGPEGPEDVNCPYCNKPQDSMEEVLRCALWRATLRDRGLPKWSRGCADIRFDNIPAGSGEGLTVMAPSLIYRGTVPCSECGRFFELAIECQVELSGERIQSLRSE